MKNLRTIFIALALLFTGALQAQVTVNVSIGSPPQWGPVGYADAHYYYLPDVEAYYDIQNSMFIYFGNGIWIHQAYLPAPYANYDLYYGYKVVMVDYHGNAPYEKFKEYKVKYKKGYRGASQQCIGPKPGKGNSKSPSNNGSYQQGSDTKTTTGGSNKNNKQSNGKGGSNGKKK